MSYKISLGRHRGDRALAGHAPRAKRPDLVRRQRELGYGRAQVSRLPPISTVFPQAQRVLYERGYRITGYAVQAGMLDDMPMLAAFIRPMPGFTGEGLTLWGKTDLEVAARARSVGRAVRTKTSVV